MDIEKALSILSNKVRELDRQLFKERNQRRHQFVDLNGIEFTRQGDKNNPATFFYSVSNDLTYYSQNEWRLIFQPFFTTVATDTSDTSLSITNNGTTINPNPHNHTLNLQINKSTAKPSGIKVLIEGIDVTTAILSQYPGLAFDDFKVYPSEDDSLQGFDITKAVEQLTPQQKKLIENPGYKKIEIFTDVPINVTLVLYLRYGYPGK